MARKTQILLEDDLNGELLTDGAGETIAFALDGTFYEIDLSTDNATKLRDDLARYLAAARKVSAPTRPTSNTDRGAKRSGGGGRTDLAEIRKWAKANGHEVSERGRIASAVVEAYDAAH
jgi:hypothetical protein